MFNSLVSGMPVYPASEYISDKRKAVCITGHREKSILPSNNDSAYADVTAAAVRLMLCRYIDMAVESGYTTFFSGLATGTDLWAADYIVRKKQSSDIKLIGVMPYLRHAEHFKRDFLEMLDNAERDADMLLTVNTDPDIVYSKYGTGSGLYRDRNYFMVDNSSAVIAFRNAENIASGTAQTMNYAYRQGRIIHSFGLNDVYAVIDKAGDDIYSIAREISFLPNVFDKSY